MIDTQFRPLAILSAVVLGALFATLHVQAAGTFDVRTFGAVGDGKTKDTAAFQKALDACQAAGGGEVSVSNGVYLIGSIVLHSNTTLRLESGRATLLGSPDVADYPIVRVRWEGEFRDGHRALISAEKADHVAVVGKGIIYGPPINVSRLRDPRGPVLMEFSECKDVTLENFTTQYQQLWSIHPVLCEKVVARNLTIRSVSFNGDGIDVDSCKNVLIERCDINTGDDALVLKSGRGAAAAKLARPTEDVIVRDCKLASSIYAGLAFGTELSGGLRNIRVENCTISGRQNGIFLKSREGRGAFIENVTCENLVVQDSPTFVAINLLNKGIPASDPVPGETDKWTRIRNVRFNNVRVDDVKDLVLARDIPPALPVDGLSLSNISGKCDRGIALANITNAALANISVTGYTGPLVTKTNVSGTGLEVPKQLAGP